jgi:hypothetical protein
MLTAPSTILARQLAHMPPLQAKGSSMPARKAASTIASPAATGTRGACRRR